MLILYLKRDLINICTYRLHAGVLLTRVKVVISHWNVDRKINLLPATIIVVTIDYIVDTPSVPELITTDHAATTNDIVIVVVGFTVTATKPSIVVI